MLSLLPGMIPIFEEQETRLERGFSLAEWAVLDYWEKVLLVAVRRTERSIKNLQSEAEIEQMRRQTVTSR